MTGCLVGRSDVSDILQLEVILAARALNLGRSWWTVASQCASLANFYLTTWEEYHTGELSDFKSPKMAL